MKIKSDFITNSSSSSFIVVFSKENPTIEEIQQELFGNQEMVGDGDSNFAVETKVIAQAIKEDMESPIAIDSLADEIEYSPIVDGNIKGMGESPDWSEYVPRMRDVGFEEAYEAYNKDLREWSEKFIQRFREEIQGQVAYKFGYSDNDGKFYSFMEHGRIFANAKMFIQISHH